MTHEDAMIQLTEVKGSVIGGIDAVYKYLDEHRPDTNLEDKVSEFEERIKALEDEVREKQGKIEELEAKLDDVDSEINDAVRTLEDIDCSY